MEKIKIAIQKSGRISEKSLELLKKAGFEFEISPRRLTAKCENFPLEILFLRSSDIPEIVNQGIADLGILGQNTIAEKAKKYPVEEIEKLNFGKCRLSIAVQNETASKKSPLTKGDLGGFLEKKSIATSYPNILKKFLTEKNINAKIIELQGSVEIAPILQIADCICDLVSTGETLRTNGLTETQEIFRSEVVLVGAPLVGSQQANSKNNQLQDRPQQEEKQKLLEKFVLRIQSVLRAKNKKYIVFNLPEANLPKIEALLPGLKGPTIAQLSSPKNWISVASVVEESQFWDTIERLKENGAEGILVTPIEKIIL